MKILYIKKQTHHIEIWKQNNIVHLVISGIQWHREMAPVGLAPPKY